MEDETKPYKRSNIGFKRIWADYYHHLTTKEWESIELSYSCLSYNKWFCRLWKKNWIRLIEYGIPEFKEGVGRTKFEAYRNALKSYGRLNNEIDSF